MDELEKSKKPPLALADASAGCIAAVLLYFVQKMPESSDARTLCLYASPVAAIIINNFIDISLKYCRFAYRKMLLRSHYDSLSAQRIEYMKVDHADADVVNEYNEAIKKTQIALINTRLVDLGVEDAVKKPKRTTPNRNNPLPPN
ncbi:hypothetical protein [Pseudomonas sp. ICMP 561]|uniref:hypothetical protein n=1 Tax=Pseudomonas sp. ICMP 561 TaxID=1718918 RepID=UPI000C089AA3|nr:hypothetical protein [Pseudomonas sp. ICMP 561]PHN28923.1 hypothetical protein AO242_25910 [Pseudomonas sp. ICMP 561]